MNNIFNESQKNNKINIYKDYLGVDGLDEQKQSEERNNSIFKKEPKYQIYLIKFNKDL